MTDTRRGGRERRGAGTQAKAGTRLKVEGDVVMADAEENPKRRAQGQRLGGRGDGTKEYGGAGGCGRSDRAAGHGAYRGYGEQCQAEREA